MLYLTNVAREYVLCINFNKRTPKTRISRIIKELNDLCTTIYRINQEKVEDWILITANKTFEKIDANVTINFISLYTAIKVLRVRFLKMHDIEQATLKNLKNTEIIINIINQASRNGYLNYYASMKRRYKSRKIAQEQKLLRIAKQTSFVCTIKFFFYWIIKILINYSSDANNEELCNDLDILLIEEYIMHKNKDLFY
jgi:hypothetical protein